MFFLDESNENENIYVENEEMEEVVVESANTDLDGIEGALIAVSECDEMWYNLREKMIKLEHVAIITEDADLLQEGKTSFGENLKNIFGQMVSAIEGIFRNFMDWITRSLGTDKAIIKRFAGKRGVVTLKGYNFDGLKGIESGLSSAVNEYLTANLKGTHTEEEIIANISKKIGMGKSSTKRSEFTKNLKEFLLGSTEKTDIKMTNDQILSILNSAKKEIEQARKSKQTIQKGLNNLIKAMESSKIKGAVNDKGTNDKGVKEFEPGFKEKPTGDEWKDHNKKGGEGANTVKSARTAASLLMVVYGQYISALKLQRNQARAAAGKISAENTPSLVAPKEDTEKSDDNKSESTDIVGILGSF